MREFEDYCWRDLVDDEVRYIYTPYVRERAVGRDPALILVHPGGRLAGPWRAAVERLLVEARRRTIPIVHSGGTLKELVVDDPVCPRPCESAFFSTDLERTLKQRGARSLIVCGAPTSGALRATAVEGKSFGYRVAIAEETAGDESSFLHKMALFDLAHKYADVMSLDELLAQL
jgi:maleamate amidohydrolase